jgi:hypothetical protein
VFEGPDRFSKSVALIDTADQPAATSALKKGRRQMFGQTRHLGRPRSKPARVAGSADIKGTLCVYGFDSSPNHRRQNRNDLFWFRAPQSWDPVEIHSA